MSYNKLDLASFKTALKEGKYNGATGARRAVGKATTLSDAEKNTARKAIDAHFGSEPQASAPVKAASKKSAVKKTAPKKAEAAPKAQKPAAAPRRTATTPAKKKAAAKKSAGRNTKAKAPAAGPADYSEEVQAIPGFQSASVDFENLSSIATQVRLAERTIQNVGSILSVVNQTKVQYPDSDLSTVVEDAGSTISGAVAVFQSIMHRVVEHIPASTLHKKVDAPATTPVTVNGVISEPIGGALFHESAPGGDDAEHTHS